MLFPIALQISPPLLRVNPEFHSSPLEAITLTFLPATFLPLLFILVYNSLVYPPCFHHFINRRNIHLPASNQSFLHFSIQDLSASAQTSFPPCTSTLVLTQDKKQCRRDREACPFFAFHCHTGLSMTKIHNWTRT